MPGGNTPRSTPAIPAVRLPVYSYTVENETNEKELSLAIGSRTTTSVVGSGNHLVVRFAQNRNYQIQTFGYYVPVRRGFCGRRAQGIRRSRGRDRHRLLMKLILYRETIYQERRIAKLTKENRHIGATGVTAP